MYLYAQIDTWDRNNTFARKQKLHAPGRDASARPRPPPAEQTEWVSESRGWRGWRWSIRPGGELIAFPGENSSKVHASKESWEEFTAQHTKDILHIFVFTYLRGGLRRGGLTPALAPRMLVMTEDVGKSRPRMRQNCQGVHKKWMVFEWRATENTVINEPPTNSAIRDSSNVQINLKKKGSTELTTKQHEKPTQTFRIYHQVSLALVSLPFPLGLLEGVVVTYCHLCVQQQHYYCRENCTYQ